MPVLLKNKTRELKTYNVGDRSVTVSRTVPAKTKSGQVGTKQVTKHVSSSITLMPKGTQGDSMVVDGIVLKQSSVRRDIDNGDLLAVEQDVGAPAPAAKVEVKATVPIETTRTGSAPVLEEGRGSKPSLRRKKASKETDA